eukprot:CAMPEP_0170580706 /NCGR_PEP_ID=MMETSP0224-20130122/6650_1 /TAXON_ID=285029 /ORGANISM="Togula jolla, Strain CCCM 725" /LENGTH=70 /DNA_ID=CAMNT_0010903795 /DNA_START=105 /DNA_END=317 /DNA_ORIENTATION=+
MSAGKGSCANGVAGGATRSLTRERLGTAPSLATMSTFKHTSKYSLVDGEAKTKVRYWPPLMTRVVHLSSK